MKRMIKANKYTDGASKARKQLAYYGNLLAQACNAESDEELAVIADKVGIVRKYIRTPEDAIKYIVETLDDMASSYLLSANAAAKFPEVQNEVIEYIESLGYNLTKLSKTQRPFEDSYVIIPADECKFEDLKTVASAVSKYFGIKPDTGIIGGSWTAYNFYLDGIRFRIGFEEDLDFDPTGKESSLQLGF